MKRLITAVSLAMVATPLLAAQPFGPTDPIGQQPIDQVAVEQRYDTGVTEPLAVGPTSPIGQQQSTDDVAAAGATGPTAADGMNSARRIELERRYYDPA